MKSINKVELHEIFKELENNKNNNFNELYAQYSNLIYRIAFSILKNKENSEDVMQKVFLKIWKMDENNLPTNNEASWLYSITKNEALNYIRANKNTLNIEELYYVSCEDKEINEMLDRDSYNRIIAGLNIEEQEIVSMKILSNLSFKEISQILNKPIGTVKWRYYKSINTLKILLSNLGMFVVSFISSVIAFKNGAKSSDSAKQEIVEDTNLKDDEEIKGKPIEEDKTENSLLDKEEQIGQNTIVETPVVSDNTNYIGISFIGISIFFLIITIIFFIIFTKHQLKRKKKVSK